MQIIHIGVLNMQNISNCFYAIWWQVDCICFSLFQSILGEFCWELLNIAGESFFKSVDIVFAT